MPKAKFPGKLSSLPKICEFVVQSAEKAELDEMQIYAVELAVDEACTNIVEHAYGGEEQGDIECTCQVTDKGLTVILRDTGRPFVPDDVPAPNINAPLEELQSRGAGLYLMRKMMDKVKFEFNPAKGNTLTMFKKK